MEGVVRGMNAEVLGRVLKAVVNGKRRNKLK